MPKVKLGLRDLSPDEKVDLANTIKTAMTGNANFTTPIPPLATIATLTTSAQTKIALCNTTRALLDTQLSDRDAALTALSNGLTQEAD